MISPVVFEMPKRLLNARRSRFSMCLVDAFVVQERQVTLDDAEKALKQAAGMEGQRTKF